MSKWKNIKKFKNGHRLWKNTENGKFYIADESADDSRYGHYGTPDETEGGPFCVDPTRPIKTGWETGVGHWMSVPVVCERSGEATTTGGTVSEVLYLAARFGYIIESEDGYTHAVGMAEKMTEEERREAKS